MQFFSLQHEVRWLFLFHAIMGTLALGIFLIPLLTKKGGTVHVKVGWIYTYAMIAVGFSAFFITPWRIFFDVDRNSRSQSFAMFLFFIAVFTLSGLNFGIQALRNKKRQLPSRSLLHIGPPSLVIITALISFFVGVKTGSILLMAFPVLACLAVREQFTYWLNAPTQKMHWWYAHMNGMFTACIATVTAFLVTALPRVLPGTLVSSPVLWIAPGLIMGTIANRWTKKYKVQFNDE